MELIEGLTGKQSSYIKDERKLLMCFMIYKKLAGYDVNPDSFLFLR